MLSKFWNVLVITYYISYLFLIIPPLALYYLFANGYRRRRNKRTVSKILKKGGLPKELQKGIRQSYRDQLKTFKIINLVKNSKGIKGSKDEDKTNFAGFFKFTTS